MRSMDIQRQVEIRLPRIKWRQDGGSEIWVMLQTANSTMLPAKSMASFLPQIKHSKNER